VHAEGEKDRIGAAVAMAREQVDVPSSISSIKEATKFSSAVGPAKAFRERDWDAAMKGKARDARVVPRLRQPLPVGRP
jgi:hypothetical protein